MTVVCGKNGLIYISGTGNELGEANSWSISIDTDSETYISFGDTWKKACTGGLGWSGSIASYQEASLGILQDVVIANAACAILIYPDRNTLADYYSGDAVFSFSSEGSVGPPVGVSVDFVGDDTLTIVGMTG